MFELRRRHLGRYHGISKYLGRPIGFSNIEFSSADKTSDRSSTVQIVVGIYESKEAILWRPSCETRCFYDESDGQVQQYSERHDGEPLGSDFTVEECVLAYLQSCRQISLLSV